MTMEHVGMLVIQENFESIVCGGNRCHFETLPVLVYLPWRVCVRAGLSLAFPEDHVNVIRG